MRGFARRLAHAAPRHAQRLARRDERSRPERERRDVADGVKVRLHEAEDERRPRSAPSGPATSQRRGRRIAASTRATTSPPRASNPTAPSCRYMPMYEFSGSPPTKSAHRSTNTSPSVPNAVADDRTLVAEVDRPAPRFAASGQAEERAPARLRVDEQRADVGVEREGTLDVRVAGPRVRPRRRRLDGRRRPPRRALRLRHERDADARGENGGGRPRRAQHACARGPAAARQPLRRRRTPR